MLSQTGLVGFIGSFEYRTEKRPNFNVRFGIRIVVSIKVKFLVSVTNVKSLPRNLICGRDILSVSLVHDVECGLLSYKKYFHLTATLCRIFHSGYRQN